MKKSDWKNFEAAVAEILRSLDPKSKIFHDKIIADIDTNRPRQRDVWIETKYGNHIPITILVSCKCKSRKLNQQDIDAFFGEIRSAAANKGVLYSR